MTDLRTRAAEAVTDTPSRRRRSLLLVAAIWLCAYLVAWHQYNGPMPADQSRDIRRSFVVARIGEQQCGGSGIGETSIAVARNETRRARSIKRKVELL